jgi:hypothetical protein
MTGPQVIRDDGDLTYKAQVLPGLPVFDGYALVLIRYQWGRDRQRVTGSHYWMLDDAGGRWVPYDGYKGEVIGHTRVFALEWPAAAYAVATHVQEATARSSLEGAIYEMGQKESSESSSG